MTKGIKFKKFSDLSFYFKKLEEEKQKKKNRRKDIIEDESKYVLPR